MRNYQPPLAQAQFTKRAALDADDGWSSGGGN